MILAVISIELQQVNAFTSAPTHVELKKKENKRKTIK